MATFRPSSADLLAHYERTLGPCAGRWINDPRDPERSLADVRGLRDQDLYQVLRFDDRPEHGARTYVTYGLSREVLTVHDPRSDQKRVLRLELLACAREDIPSAGVAYVLMTFGNAMLRKMEAPFNGEVIDWGGPVLENPGFRYLYVAEPLLLREEFAVFDNSSPETVLAWLLPTTAEEASFAISKGYRTFNELLRKSAEVLAFDRRAQIRIPPAS